MGELIRKTRIKLQWIYHSNQGRFYPELKIRVPVNLVEKKYAPCTVIEFDAEVYDDLTIVFKPREVVGIDEKCLSKIRSKAVSHNDN